MNSTFVFLFTLWLCFGAYGTHGQTFSKVCSRIYFQRNEYSSGISLRMPVQLTDNNIFVKTSVIHNNFPVYKAERRRIYFMYNSRTNQFVFSSSSTGYRVFSDLKLTGQRYTIMYKRWLRTANNSTLPFGTNIFSGTRKITPQCVSLYTTSFCGSGQPIYFTANYTSGNVSHNNPVVDSFEPVPNLFLNYRPVYRHTNFAVSNWYLFFRNAWYIGPNYNESLGYLHSTDKAIRPELITEKWLHWNGTKWVPYPLTDIRFQCRGQKTPCSQADRCTSRGKCYINNQNESVCACEFGWTGPKCKQSVKQCPATYDGSSLPLEEGMIWTKTCNQYYPSHVSYMCLSNGWKHYGRYADCVIPTTRPTTPWNRWSPWTNIRTRSPTVKPWNADKDTNLLIAVILLATLLPFFFPLMHWCGLVCKRSTERYDLNGKLIEGTESKTPSCGRICSMHFYVGK